MGIQVGELFYALSIRRADIEAVKAELAAIGNTAKTSLSGARSATDPLKQSVQALRNEIYGVRSAYIAGTVSEKEFRTEMARLKDEAVNLTSGLSRQSTEYRQLNVAAATAERGLASLRGEASRLGLASQVQIALQNQFGQALARTGPLGSAAALGISALAQAQQKAAADALKLRTALAAPIPQLGGITVGAGLAAGAILGVGTAAAALVRRGIPEIRETERALNILRASGESVSLERLKGQLTDLQREGGRAAQSFSRSQLAGALAETVKAGVDAADALELLKTGTQLAAAEQQDLSESTGLVLKNLRQYGLDVDQAARVGDALAQAGLLAAGSAKDLSEGLATVGPAASAAGLSIEQTLGLLVNLDNKGLSAAQEGATGLRNILTALADPGSKARDMLDKLGVSLVDGNGKARSLRDVLSELRVAINSNEEALQAAATVFDTRGVTAILALDDTTDQYTQTIEASTDALKNYADEMTQGGEASSRLFEAAMDDLASTAAEFFNPALTNAANNLATFIRWLDSASAQMTPAERAAKSYRDEIEKLARSLKDVKDADDLMRALDNISGKLTGPAKAAWEEYTKKIRDSKDEIRDVASVAKEAIAELLGIAAAGPKAAVQAARQSLDQVLRTVTAGSSLLEDSAKSRLQNAFAQGPEKLANTLRQVRIEAEQAMLAPFAPQGLLVEQLAALSQVESAVSRLSDAETAYNAVLVERDDILKSMGAGPKGPSVFTPPLLSGGGGGNPNTPDPAPSVTSTARAVRTVSDVIRDYQKALADAERMAGAMAERTDEGADSYNLQTEKVRVLEGALRELVGMGLGPMDGAVANVIGQLNDLGVEIAATEAAIRRMQEAQRKEREDATSRYTVALQISVEYAGRDPEEVISQLESDINRLNAQAIEIAVSGGSLDDLVSLDKRIDTLQRAYDGLIDSLRKPIPVPEVKVSVGKAVTLTRPDVTVSVAQDPNLKELRERVQAAQKAFEEARTDEARRASLERLDIARAELKALEDQYRDVALATTATVSIKGDDRVSLSRLRSQLAEAQRAFDDAFDDTARTAAQALIDQYGAAILEIERRYRDQPLAVTATVTVDPAYTAASSEINRVVEQLSRLEDGRSELERLRDALLDNAVAAKLSGDELEGYLARLGDLENLESLAMLETLLGNLSGRTQSNAALAGVNRSLYDLASAADIALDPLDQLEKQIDALEGRRSAEEIEVLRAALAALREETTTNEAASGLAEFERILKSVIDQAEGYGLKGLADNLRAIAKEAGISFDPLDKLEDEINALEQGGQRSAEEILALRDAVAQLREEAEAAKSLKGLLDLLNTISSTVRQVGKTLGGVFDELAQGVASIIDGVGQIASGNLLGGILSIGQVVIGGLISLFTGGAAAVDAFNEALKDTQKNYKLFQKLGEDGKLRSLIDESNLIKVKEVRAGGLRGLFGGMDKVFDKEASAFGLSIATSIENGMLSGLRSGMDKFLETGKIEDLVFGFEQGLYEGITNALFAAIVEQGIIQAVLGPKLLELTQAIADGAKTGDYSRAVAIANEIKGLVPELAASLAPVFGAIADLKPKDPNAAPDKGKTGGRQISEITGPTRDLLLDALSPLASLDSLLGVGLQIRDILNSRLPNYALPSAPPNVTYSVPNAPAGVRINTVNIYTQARDPRGIFNEFTKHLESNLKGRGQ